MGLFVCSCSQDDASDDLPQSTEDTVHLVRSEIQSPERSTQYLYDSENRLEIWKGTFPNVNTTIQFLYTTQGQVSGWDFEDTSGYTNSMEYEYDTQGRLIAYHNETSDNVTLSYTENTAILSGTIEGNQNVSATLQFNQKGQVIQLSENQQYTLFEYDTRGNMVLAALYLLDGTLLTSFTMTYDNSPNPFYGKLSSIYIERFMEWFWRFDGIYIGGFEGYGFAYQPNNMLSVSQDGELGISNTYDYNENNYPISVARDFYGNQYQFDISY